jgi:hypothetical protein
MSMKYGKEASLPRSSAMRRITLTKDRSKAPDWIQLPSAKKIMRHELGNIALAIHLKPISGCLDIKLSFVRP